MTEFLEVKTTIARRDEAHQIAQLLVERRLAGCVQIRGPITSVYRWQGAVEKDEEWQCTVKTTRELFPAVEQVIREHHPYGTPEIIAVPIVAGSEDYLKWLAEMTTQKND
jgi:periplasmic divalent cation tolerance protein